MPNSEVFKTMFSKRELILMLQGSGTRSGYSQAHTPHFRFAQTFTHTHRALPQQNPIAANPDFCQNKRNQHRAPGDGAERMKANGTPRIKMQ